MYQEYVDEIKSTLDAMSWESLDEVVALLHNARVSSRKVFVFGNGGSASTAQHMACDLNKNTRSERLPPFRVMCLSDNTALVSAFANDEGYETVFSGQLESFLEPNDVAIAISASGNSANVLEAVSLAKARGAYTVGWSGYDGGKLASAVDISLVVPNHCIEQIEDIHLMLEHMVTSALRRKGCEPYGLSTDHSGLSRSNVATQHAERYPAKSEHHLTVNQ